MLVEAAAGENWHDFVRYSLTQGWFGLENLSLIPGTVGACPVQNIGAYGVEVKDLIDSVVCARLDADGEALTLGNADCRFAYRDSVFKHEGCRLIILDVTFALPKQWTPNLRYAELAAEPDLTERGFDSLAGSFAFMRETVIKLSSKVNDFNKTLVNTGGGGGS